MTITNKDHIRYFEKQLKKLDYALLHADRRNSEEEVQNIRKKMEHYRAAIKAITRLEILDKPDGWEG